MAMLTVMGDKLAKKGLIFIYNGPSSECKDCKVKNICFHLEKGSRYKIVGVRDVKHDCKLHENGVRIIEVEKVPVPAALDKKQAMEGSTITLILPNCRDMGCKSRDLCFAIGLESKKRYKVAKVKKKLKCSKGYDRVEVIFE